MTVQSTISSGAPWYALFSRGARDWLRHNEKIRQSVKQHLPDLVAEPDLMSNRQEKTVNVPVYSLEHARFRLSDTFNENFRYAGQGSGKNGDVLHPVQGQSTADDGMEGGRRKGELQLVLELKVDDIVDWLWDELKLPDLQPRQKMTLHEEAWVREGWDRHGARTRLDRRKTLKEAVKRRKVQGTPLLFSNEDLRFRQLSCRRKPATHAVIVFALDVSASMTYAERKLAKTFFFFVLQGIRRKYGQVEIRFIAHTTQAWEFSEMDFFQVTGSGGTGASTAFDLASRILEQEYVASQYNAYFFYASDGENFTEDRQAAIDNLLKLNRCVNYMGYVETIPGSTRPMDTEMKMICAAIESAGITIGRCVLNKTEDIWVAIRQFFTQQAVEVRAD